jgi:phosphatidylethanolamine/phosphatidyl-N-methylethanolamine N-methyltransferase
LPLLCVPYRNDCQGDKNVEEASTRSIYNVWAHFYDHTMGRGVQRRQQLAIERMNILPGQRILDVGIGTGLSLDLYPRNCKVVGIDISEGMLAKAADRIDQYGYDFASLAVADALHLPFCDASFDHAFITHVITVVSDPVQLIEETRRVCKVGGKIVIVNHFLSGNRLAAALERLLRPICEKIGWRSDLSLEHLIEQTGLPVDYRYKLDSVDVWETVFVTNDGPRRKHASIAA